MCVALVTVEFHHFCIGQHPFDLLDLELRVVEIVEQLSMHVLQQDSRCNKCSRVATGSLAVLCTSLRVFLLVDGRVFLSGPCSGKYGLVDAPPSKFHDYVGACTVVSKSLKMEILEETCQGHLAA